MLVDTGNYGGGKLTKTTQASAPLPQPVRFTPCGSMRVLLINKYAHVTGGADQNCLGLGRLLADRGHAVAILSTASSQNLLDTGAFIEPTVSHWTREGLNPGARARIATRAIWNGTASAAMHKLLATFQPDVVHAHKLYPQLSVAPVVLAAREGVPVVQTLHDYELLSASALDEHGRWVDRDEARLSFRALNTATYPIRRAVHAPRVDAFIACSRFVAERYRAKVSITAHVLPYFVVPTDRTAPGFGDRRGALFVGRLKPEKGVGDVLELARERPQLPVSVVGSGPLEGAVVRAAQELDNLSFLGHQAPSRVMRLLAQARVLVMPSRWQEPGGIAALEAMSVGTPVVAYANGGLKEYVSDAGGGLAVEPRVSALAGATCALHDNVKVWSELSRRARGGTDRLHSPGQYAARVEELYASLLLTRGARRSREIQVPVEAE